MATETIDRAQFLARHIVSLAIDDEIEVAGSVYLTPTLACFLEHRIAVALRERLPAEQRRRWFDA